MKNFLLITIFCLFSVGLMAQNKYELNNSFIQGTGFDGEVHDILEQSDGKLILGGEFTSYDGNTAHALIRLNTDGSIDNTFDAGTTFQGKNIYDIELTSDQKILAGGDFDSWLLRLNSDGTVDNSFNLAGTGLDSTVYAIAIDPADNDIMIGGSFYSYDGTMRRRIARLTADGALDTSFDPLLGAREAYTGDSTVVHAIDILDNGDMFVAGDFRIFGISGTAPTLAKVSNTGLLQTSDFNVPENAIIQIDKFDILGLSDGSAILASYSAVTNETRVAKFNSDGTTNGSFESYINSGGSYTYHVSLLDNNDILAAGNYGIIVLDSAVGGDDFTNIGCGTGFSNNVGLVKVNNTIIDDNGNIYAVGAFDDFNGTGVGNVVKLTSSLTIDNDLSTDASVCAGDDVQLSVEVSSSNTLNYEWQVNEDPQGANTYTNLSDDANYSGTTSSTLTISAESGLDQNIYRVVVSSSGCDFTSAAATLTVDEAQSITTQPTNTTVCYNENALFTVENSGAQSDYQWQVDSTGNGSFEDLPGRTASQFSVKGDSALSELTFRVVLSNCSASVISNPVSATVVYPPVIESISDNVSLCNSGDASFNVEATSESTLSYQWQYYTGSSYVDLADGGLYSGVTTNTLSITGADQSIAEKLESSSNRVAAFYRCVITDGNGCSTETRLRELNISFTEATITSQPESDSLCYSTDLVSGNFLIQVDNPGVDVAYQWQVDKGDGSGFTDMVEDSIFKNVTSNRLVYQNANDSISGYQFRALVGPCGPVISDTVNLVIDREPTVTVEIERRVLCEAESTTITASASDENVTYQWQESNGGVFNDITDNLNYVGTDSSTLILMDIPAAFDNNRYRCIVSSENGLCEAESGQFRIEVARILNPGRPGDQEICEDLSFQVGSFVANFDRAIHSYQWQVKLRGSDTYINLSETDSLFTGFNESNNLQISRADVSLDSSMFRLAIVGCVDTAFSNPNLVEIRQKPRIISSPLPEQLNFCEGDMLSLGIEATGYRNTITWQVRQNPDANFSDVNSGSNFVLRDIRFTNDEYEYRAKVVNGCNEVIFSDTVKVLVDANSVFFQPNLINQDDNVFCLGESFEIGMTAIGDTVNYQWQVDAGDGFQDIADDDVYQGANSDTLQVLNTSNDMSQNTTYRCIISGLCEEETTDELFVSVIDLGTPSITQQEGQQSIFLSLENYNFGTITWFGNERNLGNGSTIEVLETGDYYAVIEYDGCSYTTETITIDQILSISRNIDRLFEIYPNPAVEVLHIKLLSDRSAIVNIYGLSGKEILKRKVNDSNSTIDISTLKNGIYIIELNTNDYALRQRLMVR